MSRVKWVARSKFPPLFEDPVKHYINFSKLNDTEHLSKLIKIYSKANLNRKQCLTSVNGFLVLVLIPLISISVSFLIALVELKVDLGFANKIMVTEKF